MAKYRKSYRKRSYRRPQRKYRSRSRKPTKRFKRFARKVVNTMAEKKLIVSEGYNDEPLVAAGGLYFNPL